ncbi:PAAR-like protein [Prevotella intermedia]|uniref:Uncharacterized protein n=1 Tax=Prevotella intermedia TaxID=28131 RepID=A0A2D3LIP4_PREIN|nr:PAAR-like protein [Prevotella intermedia]ATV30482.1 hypothetical protein CTM46_02835 [Prevotella intermedia]PJI23266.1 hypothetical protein CTM45_08245 [Prevotella intermedia]
MSQVLVPDGVYLVCTKGLINSQLTVTSQSSVTMESGKLVGTEEDRMDRNMNCAAIAVGAAIIGALIAGIIAAATVTTGGLAGAAIVGAIAAGGAAVGGGLGALIPCLCGMLTNNWQGCHPNVEIESKKLLLSDSLLPCKLGGQIMIFYSKSAADSAISLNRYSTAFDIGTIAVMAFATGLTGGFKGITTIGKGVLEGFSKFGTKIGFQCLGKAGLFAGGSLAGGYFVDKGIDMAKDVLGVNVSPPETNIHDIRKQKDEDKKDGIISQPDLPGGENVYTNGVNPYKIETSSKFDLYTFAEQEIGSSTTTSDVRNGAIISTIDKKTDVAFNIETSASDRTGYMATGTRIETTTGSQYTPTGAKSNFTTAFKDSFTKSNILTALGMAFLKDMLAAVENPLLKNTIKEYMDCLEEENKARAKILEYEEDI